MILIDRVGTLGGTLAESEMQDRRGRSRRRRGWLLLALGEPFLHEYLTWGCQQGDIILLSLREFQDGKADVIIKYKLATSWDLYSEKAYGELPENAKINETDTFGEDEGECTFEFGENGEVDIDDI
ncbi:hypothetical protein EDB86DRAFT_3240968 [Lactarius hatsudake]|nr:hypothetical protein EDB86DRAFT_3240968 [Lactarius hatsudake]